MRVNPNHFGCRTPATRSPPKYYVDDFDVKFMGDKDRIEIWTKSASEYGKLPLALFTKKQGELYFKWSEGAGKAKSRQSPCGMGS